MSTFPTKVWTTLNTLDVSSMVEQKGGLSYLSWANAWTSLMNVYPDSSYVVHDDSVMSDGTVEVCISVTVSDGEEQLTRFMRLPVMDYKNNAIPNPNSRLVSDNRMRCLVKCIALFGLGLFLYRGEDIPSKPAPKKKAAPVADDKVIVQLKEYEDRDLMSPRRKTWLNTKNNTGKTGYQRVTSSQAETIINECLAEEHKEVQP